jgi:hypothetical protein
VLEIAKTSEKVWKVSTNATISYCPIWTVLHRIISSMHARDAIEDPWLVNGIWAYNKPYYVSAFCLIAYTYLFTYSKLLAFLIFKVGVFSTCNVTDKWSWTSNGSLQYKQGMCLKPETGGATPDNSVMLVLDSACNEAQNFFEFSPSKYHLVLNEND